MDRAMTMLPDVTPRSRNVHVRVRVLHSWWQAAPGKEIMLEVILADEQGNLMAASLRGKLIDQWKNIMTEGATVLIKTFTVASNGTAQNHRYQPTAHRYKIVFSPNTIVKGIQDFTGSQHAFYFRSFSEIANDDSIKDQHCVDVIGCLIKMGDIIPFKRKEVESTRMVCYLKDLESMEIKLTLFGKFIELLTDEVSKQDPNRPIVVILRFGKVNVFGNIPKGVANAFNGSKLFVNNDIQEIRDFLQRYQGSGIVERVQRGNTQSGITNPCDFFKDCAHEPLADFMTHEEN